MRKITPLTISIIAIALSFIAIGIVIFKHYPRTDLDFDYLGLIVGILAFLVTVLLGWQIINVITIRREMRKIVKISIRRSKKKILRNVTLSFTQAIMNNLMCYYQLKDWKTLFILMKSLVSYIVELNDKELAELFVKVSKKFSLNWKEFDLKDKEAFNMFLDEFQHLSTLAPEVLKISEELKSLSSK